VDCGHHFIEEVRMVATSKKSLREDLVHMGTSALITSKILKISKSHTSIFSKIMALNI
jgi:hypothetical protein